jgi:hypothetical protein
MEKTHGFGEVLSAKILCPYCCEPTFHNLGATKLGRPYAYFRCECAEDGTDDSGVVGTCWLDQYEKMIAEALEGVTTYAPDIDEVELQTRA